MTSSSHPEGARAAGGHSIGRLVCMFAIAYAVGLALIYLDLSDGQGTLHDVDDQMRQLQIQHFLFGGASWWDLGLPKISMPEAYISPWSRLVDAPYILISLLLAPIVGAHAAFSLSLLVWPPLMMAIFCLQIVSIHRSLGFSASIWGYLITAAATFCSYFAIWEFAPGRIDHHNLQILVLMTMLIGLLRWDRRGGLLIGLGALMSLAIALEGLPFIVIIFAGLVIAFLCACDGASDVVKWASGTMVLLSLPLALVLLGPAGLASTQCDAFSAPYIFLVMGFCSVLWAATVLPYRNPWGLLFGMAAASVVLLVVFAKAFPQCLQGPYWMIDPVSKTYWFDRISQEHSILYYLDLGQVGAAQLMAFFLAVLVLAMPVVLVRRERDRVGVLILMAVALFSLIATVLLTRYMRFAFAFIPLFLPMAVRFFVDDGRRMSVMLRYSVMIAVLVCISVPQLFRFWPVKGDQFDAADYIGSDKCQGGDFSPLQAVAPGRIMATHVLGSYLALSLPDGFSVAAVPFHRASPGMRRMFEAFLTSDPAVRREALAPFDYLAACRFPLKTDIGTAPLYDTVSAGGDWPGLIRLPSDPANPFQLFRIDHATLR